MTTTRERGVTFWTLQVAGWLLLVYLVYAQGISAFDYQLGVTMGTQEPVERITEVGAAFWYGFALGDLLVYIPILSIGLIGHLQGKYWGRITLAAAMGITVYWPIVSLSALVDARDAAGWSVPHETPYWIVCVLIAAWGAVGLYLIAIEFRQLCAKLPSDV